MDSYWNYSTIRFLLYFLEKMEQFRKCFEDSAELYASISIVGTNCTYLFMYDLFIYPR